MSEDHKYIKDWKKEQVKMILLVHPEWENEKEKIKKFLNKQIDKNLIDPEVTVDNNYRNKSAESTALSIYDYIQDKKFIIAGGGVVYQDQHHVNNPPAKFLDGSMKKRKAIKKKMKTYKPGSYEYDREDRSQKTEKVVANSFYGASGNETASFYNLYNAVATTSSGQSLISTMMCSFESFYSNNILFYSDDDMILYVKNCVYEWRKNCDFIQPVPNMENVSVDIVKNKLISMYDRKRCPVCNEEIMQMILCNLTDEELNFVYYKSNLFEFISVPFIKNFITKIMGSVKSFRDPNNVPEEIQPLLEKFWNYLNDWVVYNYPVHNRLNRLKFQPRKAVVTIDTDSNMVNIGKWMHFVLDDIDKSDLLTQDDNELMYIACNTMCYILTKYTQVILENYAKHANIPDDYAPRLNMKNELLYLRMVLSDTKKRYAGIIRLREGQELIPEKNDTKGLDYMKSTTSEQTSTYFKNLVADDILYADKIIPSNILMKVKSFGRFIERSLKSGEKYFLIPISVKEVEAYDKPFTNPGIKGVYVWNIVYPDQEIILPEKVTLIKVKMDKLSNIAPLQQEEPEIYHRLVEAIYNNSSSPLYKSGIGLIALPSSVDKIPDWIIPYIDTSTVVNDNLTKIYPVLKSLGIVTPDTHSNDAHYSNIISF